MRALTEARPSEAGAEAPASLQAEWSNWWGSPQLYARVLACMVREAGIAASVTIVFRSRHGHEERFDSVDAFLAQISPEMLRTFSVAQCSVSGPLCEADLEITRRLRAFSSRVSLDVRAADANDAQLAMGTIIRELNRGYRPFWGGASWPAAAAPMSRYQRHGAWLREGFDLGVAALFGLAAVVGATRVSGVEHPPAWALILMLAAGTALVFGINRLVPAVEIATHGRTRLRVMSTRLGATAGAWIAAQVLRVIAGG